MSQQAGVQYVEDAIDTVSSFSGGVYARQRPPSLRPPSLSQLSSKSRGREDDLDKDGDVDDRDVKQKQVFHPCYPALHSLLNDAPGFQGLVHDMVNQSACTRSQLVLTPATPGLHINLSGSSMGTSVPARFTSIPQPFPGNQALTTCLARSP